MKSCMDKIYFPISPIYQKMRAEDKKKEQLIKDTKNMMKGGVSTNDNQQALTSVASELDIKKLRAQ
jgi:hypothetical protein